MKEIFFRIFYKFWNNNRKGFLFPKEKISVDINLNTESTDDHYKEEIGSPLILDLKICRFRFSRETHDGNEFHSLDGRCKRYDQIGLF